MLCVVYSRADSNILLCIISSRPQPHQGIWLSFHAIFATAAQVHEGMMQAATFVHTNAYEALQAAAERFSGWPVMLTGHSMGGVFVAVHLMIKA